MKKTLVAVLLAVVSGCAFEEIPVETTETSQEALTSDTAERTSSADEMGDGEQADEQAVVANWRLPSGLTTLKAGEAVSFSLRNTTDASIEAAVVLEITGLGVSRQHPIGTVNLPAKGTVSLAWQPSGASIRPTATSAQVRIFAKYTIEDVTVRGTTHAVSYAVSAAGDTTYISPDDDAAVRLASAGRVRVAGKQLDQQEREELLNELGSQHGWLDGARIDRSANEAAEKMMARGADDLNVVNDSISFPGALMPFAQQAVEETSEVIAAPQPTAGPTFMCGLVNPVPAKTGKICMYYRPDFIDTDVTSSVVAEDFEPYDSSASYANARIYVSGATTNIWAGRLDANGCTPVVTYCTASVRAELQLNSIRVPNTITGTGIIYGTRDFQISPPAFYNATMYFGSDAFTGAPLAWARVASTSNPKQIRVASIVSEILRMPDNGVLRNSPTGSPVALTINVDNGCVGNADLWYAPGLYGGACAGANSAYFGPELNPSTSPPTLVGTHTTQSAYVIGHELGHSSQYSSNGRNLTGGAYSPEAGMCSCDHVVIGNRLHCLQGADGHATIHGEGFAHHYATRIFNDKGANARFTYYKNVRKVTFTGANSYSSVNMSPPYPLDLGQAFIGFPASSTPKRGWASTFCNASAIGSTSTEYDYSRFFWGINGGGTASQRSSLLDVYAIFGMNSASSLNSTLIQNNALSHYSSTTNAKYLRVVDQVIVHGIDN